MKKLVLFSIFVAVGAPAFSQVNRSEKQLRRENAIESKNVEARMGRTIAAVTSAEGNGKLGHSRADTLRNIIDRMRADFSRNKRTQGFISAGEMSSYKRSLNDIDREIAR